MSASKHTPGPWSLWKDVCHGEHGMITDDAHARHIAQIKDGAPEIEANARLIAAAPELLEAMQTYIAALDGWENTNKAERRVKTAEAGMRAAIGKATGEWP